MPSVRNMRSIFAQVHRKSLSMRSQRNFSSSSLGDKEEIHIRLIGPSIKEFAVLVVTGCTIGDLISPDGFLRTKFGNKKDGIFLEDQFDKASRQKALLEKLVSDVSNIQEGLAKIQERLSKTW